MKNSSSSGNSGSTTNTVVAATTSSSSSSSLGVAVSVTSTQQPSGSLSVENCELPPRWQNSSAVVRDRHSSSDTDDCDLDIGRLVIDLEADLDSKACRSKIEMKSSGVVQKSTSLSVPGSTTTLSSATPLNSSSIQTAGINSSDSSALLSRAAKGASVGTDNAVPSHRSLVKNAQSNSTFVPVSAAQGDSVDRGLKMRIKCSQSGQGSSSSGPTPKHEITQFHSPFLTSSLDNAVALSGGVSNIAANKAANSQTSSQGSSSLGKYNYGRSSHKKDRHATKDRNKVTGAGRPFVDDLGCNNNANRSSSSHSNCATVVSKEAAGITLKSDALNDGGLPKILTSSADPYEFNMKTEDTVGLPVKKIKLDRVSGVIVYSLL